MAAQEEVDVCESWEEMDEIGLDQKLKLMSTETPSIETPIKNCKVTNVIVEENGIGTRCVMAEPAIRILKRPSANNGGQLNGENRARPVKTLEQRQKEYEEARLRILGEARSPEDIFDDNVNRLQVTLTKQDQTPKKPENNLKSKDRKVLARIPPSTAPTVIFPSPPPPGVLVIRTPRGPDGTKGFKR